MNKNRNKLNKNKTKYTPLYNSSCIMAAVRPRSSNLSQKRISFNQDKIALICIAFSSKLIATNYFEKLAKPINEKILSKGPP